MQILQTATVNLGGKIRLEFHSDERTRRAECGPWIAVIPTGARVQHGDIRGQHLLPEDPSDGIA